MEPKFQSSFIPKGPVGGGAVVTTPKSRKGSFFSFISSLVFAISIALVVAVFAYQFFLQSQIGKMTRDLEVARTALAEGPAQELIDLDNRIQATENLIAKHVVVSPLFEFLEENTVKAVRFSNFSFIKGSKGLDFIIQGVAGSYAAVALQSRLFNQSEFFVNPVFSDLNLDSVGNVAFTFSATVNPKLVSYAEEIDRLAVPPEPVEVEDVPDVEIVAPGTASTTPVSTSSPQTQS